MSTVIKWFLLAVYLVLGVYTAHADYRTTAYRFQYDGERCVREPDSLSKALAVSSGLTWPMYWYLETVETKYPDPCGTENYLIIEMRHFED